MYLYLYHNLYFIFIVTLLIMKTAYDLSQVDPERDKYCEIDDAVGNKKYPESPGHGGNLSMTVPVSPINYRLSGRVSYKYSICPTLLKNCTFFLTVNYYIRLL